MNIENLEAWRDARRIDTKPGLYDPRESLAVASDSAAERIIVDVLSVILLAVIAFVVGAMLAGAANAECLHSARAVWSAHPGAWATWHNVDGEKCWSAGERKEVVRNEQRVRSNTARLQTDNARPRPFSVAAGAVPLPRPRREAIITPHLSFEQEKAITNQLMFGTVSNRIDEAFTAAGGR